MYFVCARSAVRTIEWKRRIWIDFYKFTLSIHTSTRARRAHNGPNLHMEQMHFFLLLFLFRLKQLPLISFEALGQLVQDKRRSVILFTILFLCVRHTVCQTKVERCIWMHGGMETKCKAKSYQLCFIRMRLNISMPSELIHYCHLLYCCGGCGYCLASCACAGACVWKWKRMVMAFDQMNEINHLPKQYCFVRALAHTHTRRTHILWFFPFQSALYEMRSLCRIAEDIYWTWNAFTLAECNNIMKW